MSLTKKGTKIVQFLPILAVAIFMILALVFEWELGYWGFGIVIGLMIVIIWWGFFRKG